MGTDWKSTGVDVETDVHVVRANKDVVLTLMLTQPIQIKVEIQNDK